MARNTYSATNDDQNGKKFGLLTWKHPEDADDGALTSRQLGALKGGVRNAIKNGERGLGVPGDLNGEYWNHAGVGVSIYMHRSGVVVMTSSGDSIVTDAETLDYMSTAKAGFAANPGPVTVASDEVEPENETDEEPELVTDGGQDVEYSAMQDFAALIGGKLALDAYPEAGAAKFRASPSTLVASAARLEQEGFNVEVYAQDEPPCMYVYPRPGDLEAVGDDGPLVIDVELPDGYARNVETVTVHREPTDDSGLSDFVFCVLEASNEVLVGMDVDGWSANEWIESRVMNYYKETAPGALDSIPAAEEVAKQEDLEAIAVGRLFWSDDGEVAALELDPDALADVETDGGEPEDGQRSASDRPRLVAAALREAATQYRKDVDDDLVDVDADDVAFLHDFADQLEEESR